MKQIFILLVLVLTNSAAAQKLSMVKTFGGARYYVSDTVDVSPRQVLEILKVNETAQHEFQKGMVMNNVSGVLGFCGGLLVAAPLGTVVLCGEPEWSLAAIGVALIGGSVALEIGHRRKSRGAIELYNRDASARHKIKLRFSATGVGLAFWL